MRIALAEGPPDEPTLDALRRGALAMTEAEIVDKLAGLSQLAARRGAYIVPIGILPTLRASDFGPDCVTRRQRYHALVDTMSEQELSDFLQQVKGQVDRTVSGLPSHVDYLAKFLAPESAPRSMTG